MINMLDTEGKTPSQFCIFITYRLRYLRLTPSKRQASGRHCGVNSVDCLRRGGGRVVIVPRSWLSAVLVYGCVVYG